MKGNQVFLCDSVVANSSSLSPLSSALTEKGRGWMTTKAANKRPRECVSLVSGLWSLVPRLLPAIRKLPGRIAFLQRRHLAVLHHELIDVIGKLRRAEFQSLNRKQLLGWPSGEHQRQPGSRLVHHLEFHFGRR